MNTIFDASSWEGAERRHIMARTRRKNSLRPRMRAVPTKRHRASPLDFSNPERKRPSVKAPVASSIPKVFVEYIGTRTRQSLTLQGTSIDKENEKLNTSKSKKGTGKITFSIFEQIQIFSSINSSMLCPWCSFPY